TAAGGIVGFRIDHPDGLYDPPEYLRRLQTTRFLQLCRDAWADLAAANAMPEWDVLEPELLRRYGEVSRVQPQSALSRPLFLVVEKILEPGESMPVNWPVHGTTGYDFLGALNGLFVDTAQAKKFDAIYSKFIDRHEVFGELVYRSKKLIMKASMSSEL